MSTPKAPTPLRSSAAGGLEKEVDPEGREALELLVDEEGRLDDALVVFPVEEALLDADVVELFVSAGFPVEDAADVGLLPAEEVLVVEPERVEL